MRDAQTPSQITLMTLIRRLREGRFVIPDFQRDFEWEPWDISELMKSIFRDYYIGSLLLWKGSKSNFDTLACENIYGFEGVNEPEHIVLDGQQRLTAMYYAFLAPDVPAPRRKNRFMYYINVESFMEEDYDDAFRYEWNRGTTLRLLNDEEEQFERHIFPLSVIGQSGWALPDWMQNYQRYWEDKGGQETENKSGSNQAITKAKLAREFGEYIKELTEEYQIAYMELDKDLELGKVCDIFTQINSRGIRLDVFDLINALLRPKGLRLKELWRESEARLAFAEAPRMDVYVLQLMSILLQNYCSPKYLYNLIPNQIRQIRQLDGSLAEEILVPTIYDFESRWWNAVSYLESAIQILRHPQEFGAISTKNLPYVSILPVFAALQHKASQLTPEIQLDAKRKIKQWYWASIFTQNYSGSVESTSTKDFQDVTEWFQNEDSVPSVINEFISGFQNIDLKEQQNSTSSIYKGIFCLLVINGAQDWRTGNAPQHDDLDDHHIVPRRWGNENGVGHKIDTILNRTPLTAETNRIVVSDQLPNEYIPKLIAANGESLIRSTLESHFISPTALEILLRDPFTPDDFEEFIYEREITIKNAVDQLLISERLELEPNLRELDLKLDKIELEIRALISRVLSETGSSLPDHLANNTQIKERIDSEISKNPGVNRHRFDTLEGKLEYFDLRDLQGVFESKSTRPLFKQYLGSVEANIAPRFKQLAELRNGIRHNRTVSKIVLKDGEAAILWFQQALNIKFEQ